MVGSTITTMSSGTPTWLPSAIFLTLFLGGGFLIGMHPKIRNRYRARPDGGSRPERVPRELGSTDPGATSGDGRDLLHYKPMMGAWYGVVACCVFLAMGLAQMPWPVAVLGIPAVVGLAVLAYLRPRGAVQSLYFGERGAISLVGRGVTVPFDLNHYRYVRMHDSTPGEFGSTFPSMLVLYRDTRPSVVTWLTSVLFPRVTEERVVLFFNRWWDADGYLVGPQVLSDRFHRACARAGRKPSKIGGFFRRSGWEVRP
jgi:hypothetical protein